VTQPTRLEELIELGPANAYTPTANPDGGQLACVNPVADGLGIKLEKLGDLRDGDELFSHDLSLCETTTSGSGPRNRMRRSGLLLTWGHLHIDTFLSVQSSSVQRATVAINGSDLPSSFRDGLIGLSIAVVLIGALATTCEAEALVCRHCKHRFE